MPTPKKPTSPKPVPAPVATVPAPRVIFNPGDPAPDFALTADDGTTVRLGDFNGKPLVLYFYPKDDTPGCTREACAFRDGLAMPVGFGAAVVGVSRDGVEAHKKFKAKYGLQFPLLADTEGVMHRAYGAWGTKTLYGKSVTGAIRSTVLIDGRGKVVRHWPNVRVDGHAEAVRAAVAGIQSGT